MVPCLAATALSGLAGALSQKGLQVSGLDGKGRPVHLYTMEVSAYSALTLLIPLVWQSRRKAVTRVIPNSSAPGSDPTLTLASASTSSTSWFHDFGWTTMIPVVCKALTGFLTALVHKHAGTVAKGFALMLGLVLSTMIQAVLDAQNEPPQQQEQDSANESYEQPLARTNKQDHTEPANQADLAAVGKPASTESRRTSSMGRNQIAGTLLVLLSGWMHFTNPPKR